MNPSKRLPWLVSLGTLALAASALAAPTPPAPAPSPSKEAPRTLQPTRLSAPWLSTLGNSLFSCQAADSPDACFQGLAAGKLQVSFTWAPCAEADCAKGAAMYGVYRVIPGPLPANLKDYTQNEALVVTGNAKVGNMTALVDTFKKGDCFVVRALSGDPSSPVTQRSPSSNKLCVDDSTVLGRETVKINPDAFQWRYDASVCGLNPPSGIDNAMRTVGTQAISSGKCPVIVQGDPPPKEWKHFSLLVDFTGHKTTPQALLKAKLVVEHGMKCAAKLGVISNNWRIGNNYTTYSLHDLSGADALSFDLMPMLKSSQLKAFSLSPDFSKTSTCLPSTNVATPYVEIERIKF